MPEVDLTQIIRTETEGHSSKGNQPKLYDGEYWYKADHMGYEALAEVLTGRLLGHSNEQDFVRYEPVLIREDGRTYTGCRSRSFQGNDEMLVPLERLYRAYYGQSLAKKLATMPEAEEQIAFTVEFVEKVTGLSGFGQYLCTLLELDAFILNEDRHTNNIAVLRNEKTGQFRPCPIFDNGLSFLSDAKDYPLDGDIFAEIQRVEAKPFSGDFMTQVEAAAALYGSRLHFDLSAEAMEQCFDGMWEYYPAEVINRVQRILHEQRRKYQYLF